MNSTSTESPRFFCRVVRWWSALTERSAPTAGRGPFSGHRADCQACREYFASTAALENGLRRAATVGMPAVPSGIEQRIVDAVRRARVPAREPARRALPLWSIGLATAAATVALVLVLGRSRPSPEVISEGASADITAVVAAIQSLPQHYRETLAPSAARLAAADPLGREFDSVRTDARSALSFLAANFLPSERPSGSLLPSPQSPSQGT